METVLEKPETEPEQKSVESQEQELSPEKRALFEDVLKDVTVTHTLSFEDQASWGEIHKHWKSWSFYKKKDLVEARKYWIVMKQEGESFNNFLTEKIRTDLSQGPSYDIYQLVHVYAGLNGTVDYKFYAEMLDHKSVWTDGDGSTMHRLVEFIGESRNEAAVESIANYINHVVSPEYKRKPWLESDLGHATSALVKILGKTGALVQLAELAEKDQTLKGWIEKKKMSMDYLSDYMSQGEAKYPPEKFDLTLESNRLAILQKEVEELEEIEKNKPPPKHPISPDWFGSSFDNLDRDRDEEDAILHIPYKEPGETVLDEKAKRWEDGRLLNFYGRFKPKIEKAVNITSDNYLDGVVAASGKGKIDPDHYLGILSGVIDEKYIRKEGEELPTITEVEELYKITTMAFARGLSVGILENRIEDAISEINQAKDYVGSCAEKFDDPTQISFLLSLADQLGQLQVYLTELRDAEPLPELPESGRSFLITHPNIKRVREVADFRDLLAEKIRWYVANDLSHNLQSIQLKIEDMGTEDEKIVPQSGPSFGRLKSIFAEYKRSIELYKKVEEADVPVYWEAKESLVKDFDSKRNVVFGRDGRYFFTALKASEFGQKRAVQKYVVITSPMVDYDGKRRDLATKYLQQHGVTLDFNFIDTGFSGTIPEFAIKALADADNTHLSTEEVNSRIKLLSSSHPGRAQIARRSGSSGVQKIEDRPKSIDRPERLVLDDENGKVYPEIKPNSVKEQLRAWVVEHVSFRNFVPKLDYDRLPAELKISPETIEKLKQKGLIPDQMPEKTVDDVLLDIEKESQENSENNDWMIRSALDTHRTEKFKSFIEKHLEDIGKKKQEEILQDSLRLYEVSRDKVAPVVLDFARWCLERAKPGQKVLFLARDGLAPWIAARLLVRQGKFPGITEDQLKYAHLSRNITWQEDEATLKQYLAQLGVEDNEDDLLTVDVGMFGAIHRSLQELYPQKKVSSLYLISASRDEGIEGYLSDIKKGTSSIDPIWKSIPGNPAVHFIEDTFAGFYGSTQGLEKSEDGTIKPKIGVPYSREVYLKRLAAIDGIVDHTLSLEQGDPKKNSTTLNNYLASQFKTDQKYIMVPHE